MRFARLRKGDVIVRAQDREMRLLALRRAVSRDWMDALTLGGGNDLNNVPAQMVAGLLDVAATADLLATHPENKTLQARLRKQLDAYLSDIEILKGRVRA